MMSLPGSGDSMLTRWLDLLFNCFGHAQRPDSPPAKAPGVERELNMLYHQPHLVPPMKLVFYDEMPRSPALRSLPAHRVSHWVSHSKDLASRASSRASLSLKKKRSKQSISDPIPISNPHDLPLRRRAFQPLELSIYLPGNRLSDLPEFDHVDFTLTGEIQVPPRALIRARSEDMLQQSCRKRSQTRPTKYSMVGERQLEYWQARRPSSESVPRPPSACEGLNSHPVYWTSLPGIPPIQHDTPPPPPLMHILSPTAEVEEPLPTPKATDNMLLEFPPIDGEEAHKVTERLSIQIPPSKQPLRTSEPSHHPNTRISQWLSRSSSTFTRTSFSSSSSPSTVKNQPPVPFYQCAAAAAAAAPHHHHARTPSADTTNDTDTMSLASLTSQTTAPTTVYSPGSGCRSRSATLRSFGRHVKIVEEEGSFMPDIPDEYVQLQGKGERCGRDGQQRGTETGR